MAVETAVYVGDLNETYPAGGEPVAQGDDHIRLLKAVLKTTFAALDSGPYVVPEPEFVAGTRLVFAMAAAPTGWVQDVSDNADNRMMRVVKATGLGVGGTNSPILNNTVPSHTHYFLSGDQSADHTHSAGTYGAGYAQFPSIYGDGWAGYFGGMAGMGGVIDDNGGAASNPPWRAGYVNISDHGHGVWVSGASAGHTHSGTTDPNGSAANWAPRYIDLIVCQKS